MTVLTGRPNLVAVVQSAVTLPTTLLSVAAGAVADMYDRRLVGLAALSLSFIAAASLSAVSVAGELEPYGILIFCFLIEKHAGSLREYVAAIIAASAWKVKAPRRLMRS